MAIEANITIDVSDQVDPSDIIRQIKYIVSNINGLDTQVSVNEVDDPLSSSPISIAKTMNAVELTEE
jgi:hypothetical protein